jgi:NADH dehydrogenase
MAALNDLVRSTAESYPHLDTSEIRTVLVQPGKRLLPELSAGLAHYAQMKLQQHGVEVILNTKITGASAGAVELEGGRSIPTAMLIWTAGVTPSPVIGVLDCKRGHHGGIVVDACCAVEGHPGVWALGDCGEVPQPGGHKNYAPTAQNAMREGPQVARNIVALMQGKRPQPFVYQPIGELALVGKRSGVASLYGIHLSGLVAWALWRGIYLTKMPGLGKRVRIGLDWVLDLLGGREVAELPVARSRSK